MTVLSPVLPKYIGTIDQYNAWYATAQQINEINPSIIVAPNQAINPSNNNQCYWDFCFHYDNDEVLMIFDEKELDAVRTAFQNGEDGILALLKVRKQKDLDNYSDSDEVLTWYYNFGGINHKQMLYDKDVADIVTTANSGISNTLWSFYDNTNAQMSSSDLISFRDAAKARDEFLWSHWGTLRSQIHAASTIEALNAIDIYSGWDLQT